MKNPEIPDGQAVLLDETLVPPDEFERRRDEQMATLASDSLKAAVESHRAEAGLEPEDRFSHYEDQGIMSPDQARALRLGKGQGRLAFERAREELRAYNAKRREDEARPPENWGA